MNPTRAAEPAPERIDRFRGPFAFLSNFHRHPFQWNGRTWSTAEAPFQAWKTRDERARERIRLASSPAEAKRLGRRARPRRDWERIKDDVMHSVLEAKFAVPELRDALLATGDAELVEGNTWGDVYWGVCRGRGRNQLGRTLMRIREGIRRRAGTAMDEQHADWLRERCDFERIGLRPRALPAAERLAPRRRRRAVLRPAPNPAPPRIAPKRRLPTPPTLDRPKDNPMTRIQLPAPCHLCGQTCVSSHRGRVTRRLDRTDLDRSAKRPTADACPWRQCPHRPSGHLMPPVLEDQRSFGVVASTWPPTGRPPVVLSLHPLRGAAETDRDLLAAASPIPRPRHVPRNDYDVVEFPHALIASQLDAAQEEGYGYGYDHAMESACERLREDGPPPAATTALHRFADRHPAIFADTIRYLFRVDRDVADAVTESVRLGHALDAPLDAALNALAAGSGTDAP